jgi:hypothetical protein
MSSDSSGSDQAGVDIGLAGLSFQVFTLVIFVLLAGDYLIRFRRSGSQKYTPRRLKVFLAFLAASIVFILVRCVYRIDELSDGYQGSLIHNEGLFYGLESA